MESISYFVHVYFSHLHSLIGKSYPPALRRDPQAQKGRIPDGPKRSVLFVLKPSFSISKSYFQHLPFFFGNVFLFPSCQRECAIVHYAGIIRRLLLAKFIINLIDGMFFSII